MLKDFPKSLCFGASPTKDGINREDMTISFVAMSANNAHKRRDFFGEEYELSVDLESTSFEAKRLYLDHVVGFDSAIGNIIETKRDENGDFKIKVQFYENIAKSKEAYEKYALGLSDSVSVGLCDYETRFEKGEKGELPKITLANGKIYEVSAVWEGADANAKIANFALPTESKPAEAKAEMAKVEPAKVELAKAEPASQPAQNEPASQPASQASQSNTQAIIALAKAHDALMEGLDAIAANKSYEEFSAQLLEKTKSVNIIKKETKMEFALCELLRNGNTANFERGSRGFKINDDYIARFESPADVNKSTDTERTGGFIPTTYRGDKFIQALMAESKVLGLVDYMPGLIGQIDIPKDDTDIQAVWVDEATSSDPQPFRSSKISLLPKTLNAKVEISRTMLSMDPRNLEAYTYRLLQLAMKNKLEKSIFHGLTTEKVTGIFNTTGIQVVEDFFPTPNYKKAMEFKSKLASQNFDVSNNIWVGNAVTETLLQTTRLDSQGNTNFLIENGKMCGYRFISTNLVQDNHLAFFNPKNIVVGSWGKELEVLSIQNADGTVTLSGFYDVDVALKRANGFAVAKVTD